MFLLSKNVSDDYPSTQGNQSYRSFDSVLLTEGVRFPDMAFRKYQVNFSHFVLIKVGFLFCANFNSSRTKTNLFKNVREIPVFFNVEQRYFIIRIKELSI